MKILLKLFFALSLPVVIVVSQSCATILGGRHNTLVFPEDTELKAQVFIDDTLVGDASGKIFLPKQVIQHGSKLEIKAEGYETKEYTIIRRTNWWYVAGNFAIGAAPLIVDYATGNIYRPYPRKFDDVELKKAN